MIPDKYKGLPERFTQLFTWGTPVKPGYSYRNWEDYLHHGFSDADIPVLLELLSDDELHTSLDGNRSAVPFYTWRILGQLKSVEAIDPLIALTVEYQDNHFIHSEVGVALGMIGKPAMARVAEILLDETEAEGLKKTVAEALFETARQHPELREEVIGHFRTYLQSPNPDYYGHNGLAVAHLVNLNAVELIEEIRNLYAKDYADLSIAGDIEDVEIDLGFREERSTPRPGFGLDGMDGFSELFDLVGAGKRVNARPRWNGALDTPETYIRETPKVGRNEPCPCGSGKKYKRCCMNE